MAIVLKFLKKACDKEKSNLQLFLNYWNPQIANLFKQEFKAIAMLFSKPFYKRG